MFLISQLIGNNIYTNMNIKYSVIPKNLDSSYTIKKTEITNILVCCVILILILFFILL